MASAEELAEAFQIFAKYTDENYVLHAEHDEINVSVNPNDVNEEDLERLDEIGFYSKTEGYPEPHFYYFT